jgi:hypothetical protein
LPPNQDATSTPAKKKDRSHPGSGPVLSASTVNLKKLYAISGILFTDRSAGIFFLSQTFALHRPTNGAAAIIPNEIPNAICIQLLLSPRGLEVSSGVEPAVYVAKCCMLLQLIPYYPPPESASISHLRGMPRTGALRLSLAHPLLVPIRHETGAIA